MKTIAVSHNKYLYVKTSDFKLWGDFVELVGDKRSFIIITLIRLYMNGRLYLEDGRKLEL